MKIIDNSIQLCKLVILLTIVAVIIGFGVGYSDAQAHSPKCSSSNSHWRDATSGKRGANGRKLDVYIKGLTTCSVRGNVMRFTLTTRRSYFIQTVTVIRERNYISRTIKIPRR